jgi:hypothetical protein
MWKIAMFKKYLFLGVSYENVLQDYMESFVFHF